MTSDTALARGAIRSEPRAKPRTAIREPVFLRFFIGQSVSLVGNQVWYVALSWSAVRFASPGLAGVMLMLSSIPRLILMLFGGVVADRFDIRRLMIGSDVLRTLVTAGAALIALARPGIVLLGVLALVFGTVDAVFQPSAGAMQPRLLAPEQYAGGAVLTTLATRLALAVGAPLGGLVLAAGGLAPALLVDAVTFAVSVATLLTVRPRPVARAKSRPGDASDAASRGGFVVADLKAGLAFLVRHPVLGPMTVAFLLLNVGFIGPMNIGIAELANHRGWGSSGIGLMLAGFGLGAAAGGLATVKWRIRRNAGVWIAALCVIEGACLLAVATAPVVAVAAAGTLISGLALGPVNVLSAVLEQREAPDEFRGRVASIQLLISLGLIPMTYGATGLLIAVIGTTGVFALGGLLEVSVALTLLAPAFRRARTED